VRSPAPEDEGAAEPTCDELTVTPIPRPLALLGGRRPGRREGWAEDVFKTCFYFSLSYSDLIGGKLN